MLVKTYCAAVNGLDVTTVTIEVNLNRGVMYHFTGLGDAAVREGRDRIASALQYNGYKFPRADVTVNMAPADLRKEGSSFDLPLAIAILAAAGSIVSDGLDSYMMVGELSLDGSLQPAKGVLPIAIRARAEKFKGLIVPKQNVREAAVVNNLEVYGMENIRDVIAFLTGKERPEPTVIDTRREFYEQQYKFELDFADVRGQENVKRALEVLRQPLEDHKITISRAKYTTEFPCSFMFVASMNPCPCGYYGDPTHHCVCTPGQIQRYMSKISGPLLDRIDIQTEITPVPFKDISKTAQGEPSSAIRERVIAARRIQEERFRPYKGVHCNAQMSERMIHSFAEPDTEGVALLRTAMERLSLSARAYNRILKVARTIADLAASERVMPEHLAEAISYRNLDRGDWAERGFN